MDSMQLDLQLGYMTDAAHFLRAAAPETSAWLMTRRNELMLQHGAAQSNVQRQHVCNACGHIMVPGEGSTLRTETQKAPRGARKTKAVRIRDPAAEDGKTRSTESNARTVMTKILTCGHCDAASRISIPIPPRPAGLKAGVGATGSATAESTRAGPGESSKRSDNASSKKRAKNRKAGLQALLSKSQAASSHGSRSLSLADFMQK